MKKQLLRLSVLFVLAVFSLPIFAGDGATVYTSFVFSVDGVPLTEGDDVAVGSEISWVAQVSIPDDGKAYTFAFWPLGPKNGNENAVGWLNAPGFVQVTYPATEFSGSYTYTGAQDLGAGTIRMVQKIDGGATTWTAINDFSINWVSGDPVSEITSSTYIDEPNIQIGATISFSVDYTLVDDDTYTLEVMQNSVTTSTSPSATWIRTDSYPLSAIAGSFTINDDFITLDNHPAKGDCVAGDGNILFRLKKGTENIQDNRVTTTFSVATDVSNISNVDFSVFPNPAQNVVKVSTELGASVELYNTTGSVVKSYTATSTQEEVSIADLDAGMYIVKVTTDGKSATQKLMIK